MRIRKYSRFATLLAAFGLVFCSFQASPEDIDIFAVDENSDINNPNVLFVIDNSANWTRESQQWPENEDQGQSEVSAIKTVINELDGSVNVGLFEYVTGGSATDQDYGFVRYHIRPMTDANKDELSTILDRIYANINDPAEKRGQGNPFGSLFWDVYNYLAGVNHANAGAGTPSDPAGVVAHPDAYTSPYKTFQSPLTTLDTCTRTIVIFISNNISTDPTPDSQANFDALYALAGDTDGDGALDDAEAAELATNQINFADYEVTTVTKTAQLDTYTDLCYATTASCTDAVNADPDCAEEGFVSCSCNATDYIACPSNHFVVQGTNTTPKTVVVSGPTSTTTSGVATGQIGATCKTEGQIPASATCPNDSVAIEANTPQANQTTKTETSWVDCKYVMTDAAGCGPSKSNYEIQGTRTQTVTVTEDVSDTQTDTLGETTACYTSVAACNPEDGSWDCSLYNEGCECTTAGGTSGCAATGTKRHRIQGNYTAVEARQTGTFSAAPEAPKLYMLDEWARFLRQRGVPIAGLNSRAQVTTYTIDVFNEQQNATQSALLFNAARVGGGKYFQAKNKDALISALKQILTEVQAVNSAFSSASLPVNATNRAQNENQVFIGVFKPDRTKDPGWFGNMKQYKLISTGATIDLGDKNGNPAINNQTGFLTDCAVSFWTEDSGTYWNVVTTDDPDALSICTTNSTSDWSDSPDGPFVEKGAVAEVVRRGNTTGTPDADGDYLVERDVYTENAGVLELLDVTNFDDGDPSTDDSAEEKLVRYIWGQDIFDEDADADSSDPADRGTMEPRSTIHGDVVHSRPQPINYGGDAVSGTGVVVFYGSNDGHYRAVRARTGQELWSFVAKESQSKFSRLMNNAPIIRYFGDSPINTEPKDYFFDGSTGVYQTADNSKVWIFPTLRRGGNRVYALDVTDPYTPKFMWSAGCDATSCDEDWKNMGQTWALPNVAFMKGYCGIGVTCDASMERKPVIVMAGGYDSCEDQNNWDPPCSASTGTGVYVIDAESGKLVKYFDFAAIGEAKARSVASDVALIDVNNDSMVDYAYAVDTGGNIFRMDFIDGPNTQVELDPTKWAASFVAFTNGSGRKFLFPPALVQITSTKIYLAVGSGDREHPLRSHYPYDERDGDDPAKTSDDAYDLIAGNDTTDDPGVQNRFYVLKDDLTIADSTQAVDLDDVTLMANYSDDTDCATAPILPSSALRGWFMDLGAEGPGEQVVTSAVVAAGFVFFSTNRPTETSTTACTTSLGEARGYFMNLLNASGAIGVTGACGGTRSSTFVGGGLPPSPVLATVPIQATTDINGDGVIDANDSEVKTVVIGAVQKTGEPSSPIQSQRVKPPIASDRKPIYWYKSTGDK